MKILVTGKNGYLGKSILNKLKGYDLVGVGMEDFDLSNREETKNILKVNILIWFYIPPM